ncbi:MAG: glycerophosphoryl diester phosphodiesterase membrane domain-containing protein [Nitrososphaerota archaeon]|nr:glycerophosphoryl diester phosphodiesterase membrane domain-containing protein [Nitrososphaerota archaeon]MDG6922191.1 glycerophosphoryl diester phosphodiesterase membrane domain-containing protein [Nitrososphaerota archaeon]
MGENSNPIGQELTLGQLFQKSFELFRQNYFRVLPIFAALGIVSTFFSSLISFATPTPSIPLDIASLTNEQLLSAAGPIYKYLGYTLSNYFVSWCILYFAAGLGVFRMNGVLKNSENQRGPNYMSLAITTVLSVMIIEAGVFVFVIGALILGTMLYLVLPVTMLEGKSMFSAMGRSRQLVSGRWFKTFLLLAGVQIIVAVFSNVVGSFAGLLFSGQISTMAAIVATDFITALAFPLVSASMLVLYYSNLEKKKEFVPRPPSLYDNMRPQPIPGFPVSPNSYCSKCGAAVTQEEKFCHNCGNPLRP